LLTRMTYLDVFIGLLRPALYAGIAYGFAYLFIYYEIPFPYILGVFAMWLYYLFLRFIWRYCFGLTHIGTIDELQLYDKSTNKSIIIASCYFDRLNADLMLTNIQRRMLKYKTLRSKFVKVLD